jgi:3D (Asp-Asp-Asp) domain-containing protein
VLISRSVWRKLLATVVVATVFVLLYEVTIPDSRFAITRRIMDVIVPQPQLGTRLRFGATAYCKGTTTTSGVNVRSGIAAADPELLPVGSVITVDAPGTRNDGVYTIMDTGPRVQGRHLDLYMWSCNEALAFGRTAVQVTLLRLGWNPQTSSPSIIDRLFRRREAAAQQPSNDLPPEAEKHIPPSTLPGSDDAATQPPAALASPAPASEPRTAAPEEPRTPEP